VLASESATDSKVKRKLLSVLLSWQNQFKSDPKMTLVAGLYKQARPSTSRDKAKDKEVDDLLVRMQVVAPRSEESKRKKEREERRRREEAEKRRRQNKPKSKRAPFDFAKVRPPDGFLICSAST
jgi:hypothetical protein